MVDPAVEHGWVTVDSPDASEVNAGNLNDHVIDYDLLAEGLGMTSCLVQRTTTQTLSGNPTVIIFNATDIWDPDGWHDPAGANPERLTCPTGRGGRVFIVSGGFEYSNAAVFYLLVRKNGTDSQGQSAVVNTYTGTVAVPVYMVDGDYVELLITNQSSNSIILTDAPCTFGVVG